MNELNKFHSNLHRHFDLWLAQEEILQVWFLRVTKNVTIAPLRIMNHHS